MPLPWEYVRSQLAQRWHIPPWDIDPIIHADEINLEMELLTIEEQYKKS